MAAPPTATGQREHRRAPDRLAPAGDGQRDGREGEERAGDGAGEHAGEREHAGHDQPDRAAARAARTARR